MPNLLLEKPSRSSKSKDHLETLKRRLDLWKEGELAELLREGETMQKKKIAELSRKIKNYMKKSNALQH